MNDDLVPECPPESPSYTPTSAASSAESGFINDDISQIEELVPGGVGKPVLFKSNRKHGILVEFCSSENSALKRVAEHLQIAYLGVTKESLNVEDEETFQQFLIWLQIEVPENEGPVHLWASVPRTAWSPWQRMAIAKHGDSYRDKLEQRRDQSRAMVRRFHDAAQLVKLSRGGTVTFEWSRDSEGWLDPTVVETMNALDLKSVRVDGCAFNLQVAGKRPQRPWKIMTDSQRLIDEFQGKVCRHPKGFHDPLEGSLTTKSGYYNVAMATCIIATLFPGLPFDHIPALPVVPFNQHAHREKEVQFPVLDESIFAAIHKLLSRNEMMNDEKALKAIREEGIAMRKIGVWDDSTVMEKYEREKLAKESGNTIHLAELMSICSIKFWEIPDKRKHKARIVFRGDRILDQYGSAAKFGQMYSTPTNIQAVHLALYYGLLPGCMLRVADATRAFLQALLESSEDTYVILPHELWLPSWKGKFRRPTVRLRRALYGHPLASAYWDKHLRRVLVTSLGFEAVDGHPSVFFQHETKLLVVVYVDDILASGPKHAQDQFWPALRKEVQLDDVEELSQFLGRFHHLSPGSCVLDMRDYSREAVNLYLSIVGKSTKLRTVTTPFVSEGSLIDSDYQTTGEISDKASSILMKILWLTRLCRPDLSYPVCVLAGQVTCWSRNSDKMLFRLLCYLNSTVDLCMHLSVNDPPEQSTLDLFCDADLGGCQWTARSTSGLYLVIRGPQTFVPIAWHARRQQHVARSTADAELNSLAEGLHEELIPAAMLLTKLLGVGCIPRPTIREDNSAVVAAIRKGYSIKLRHLARTPKLSLASLSETCKEFCDLVQTPTAEQLGDSFTKCLQPNK